MLELNIKDEEVWDEVKEEFVKTRGCRLKLEHSLVSISKWEAKYHKPYLTTEKTTEETIDYIKFMTLSQNVPDEVYTNLTPKHISMIEEYINNPMTAATFKNVKKMTSSGEFITNETIYWWMIKLNIPVEFQKWHLNRLLTLIEFCSLKEQPEKKMSKNEIYSRNAALNAKRKATLKTRG